MRTQNLLAPLCLVLALFVALSSQVTEEEQKKNCYWAGVAPFCNGQCQQGYTEMRRDEKGDGLACVTGTKVLCCEEECQWIGTAPFCRGSCNEGLKSIKHDKFGDGKRCWTGHKALCCPHHKLSDELKEGAKHAKESVKEHLPSPDDSHLDSDKGFGESVRDRLPSKEGVKEKVRDNVPDSVQKHLPESLHP